MKYLRVRWRHDLAGEPVLIYCEVDDDGWEVRKVDEYAGGRRDLAGSGVETGSTSLAEARTPELEAINDDPQFEGVEITAEEFEVVWRQAREWFDLP